VRVAGVLVHEGRLLIVRQRVSDTRNWSLPGGKLEPGETLDEGMLREMREETGLDVRIERLLYVCDKPEDALVHVTFLLACESIDGLRPPTNEHEDTPISDIAFAPFEELTAHGFSETWARLVAAGFPDAPRYAGPKRNIGL
jgi:ADP-ribose pyrophosphatase YjhB (NUDIX family)